MTTLSSSTGAKKLSLLVRLLFVSICVTMTTAAVVKETLVIEEWVVDFLRPTADIHGRWPWENKAERQNPFQMDDSLKSNKYLINGSYPGPTIRAYENDTMEITVINKMFSEATTIHWHGIHMPGNERHI